MCRFPYIQEGSAKEKKSVTSVLEKAFETGGFTIDRGDEKRSDLSKIKDRLGKKEK